MKVILFGATGMVGQGVLRECLLDPDVERVLAIGRRFTGVTHDKLRELVRPDLYDLSGVAGELAGFDACFFCLGVSSVGMSEDDYRHVTYDLTVGVAELLSRQNPGMTFTYVSGTGTDSTEKGRSMWARVKGRTENALLAMPFKGAYMFRPGYIQPMHGERPTSRAVRFMYALMRPLFPFWRLLFPKYVTATVPIGRAMLRVAKQGAPQHFLESADINRIGA